MNVQSNTFKIYFMRFAVQWLNTIKYEVATFHWCFQPNLIPGKKLLEKFFYNLICVIINHDFYAITFWMHYTLFIITFRWHKANCFVNWIFDVSDFLKSFMISCKYGLILLRYCSIDSALFLSKLPYIQYTYCYWFVITFFFLIILKKVSNISNYSVVDSFIFFFQAKNIF